MNLLHFEMRSRLMSVTEPVMFTSLNAPDWLTSCKTVPGSTMDNRWFWNDFVLKMKIGDVLKTDFQLIKRIA